MKIIDPATSRKSQAYDDTATAEPIKPPTPRRKPSPRKHSTKASSARETARELARDKYGVETRKPLTAAERQRRRRSRLVGVSFELEPEVAAKLFALAEASGTNQTAVIRDLIVNAEFRSASYQ